MVILVTLFLISDYFVGQFCSFSVSFHRFCWLVNFVLSLSHLTDSVGWSVLFFLHFISQILLAGQLCPFSSHIFCWLISFVLSHLTLQILLAGQFCPFSVSSQILLAGQFCPFSFLSLIFCCMISLVFLSSHTNTSTHILSVSYVITSTLFVSLIQTNTKHSLSHKYRHAFFLSLTHTHKHSYMYTQRDMSKLRHA